MAQSFCQLNCWQLSKKLASKVYTCKINIRNQREYDFVRQITRASLSVMNNIAEGYGRNTNKEFIRFINISIGSCCEVESMLYLAEELNCINKLEIRELLDLCNHIKASLINLKKYQLSKIK